MSDPVQAPAPDTSGASGSSPQQATPWQRETALGWFGALYHSRWKDLATAVAYGIPLLVVALADPAAGLVPGLAVGVSVSMVIAVATVWRRRFLMPYAAVSVAGMLVTGHLISSSMACYTAVRAGQSRLAAALVVIPLLFAVIAPDALITHAASPQATVADSAVVVFVPVLLGCLGNVNTRMSRLAAERQAQQTLLHESLLREAALKQRERLVRDIHDGVGRQVTLMVLQAGAIAVSPGASDPVKERCQLITDAGRDAVNALREIVTLVRTPGSAQASPRGSRHELSDLAPLIKRYRDGGQRIVFDLHIARTPPDPVHQDLLYKVVAEGLSNAVRHAGGAAVDIAITQSPAELIVTVRNDAPAPGSVPLPGTGHGLTWLREEIVTCGGTLHTAPEPDGGYRLQARFPDIEKDAA